MTLKNVFEIFKKKGDENVQANSDVHYSDKFFLGGMNTLRGFRQNSIGPSESGCALGGTAYWKSGIHLYSKLDFLSRLTKGLLRV